MTTSRLYERVITCMGSPSVGKSTLMLRFTQNSFNDEYIPTIFGTKYCDFNYNGCTYKLKLLDTAGLEEYSAIPSNYITNTNGYILVYSITDRESFDNIKEIYNKIIEANNRLSVPIVLVGNKSDLNNERKVEISEGKELANKWRAPFIETSAKVGDKVKDIFVSCLNVIDPDKNSKHTSNNNNNYNNNNNLNNNNSQQKTIDNDKKNSNCQIS